MSHCNACIIALFGLALWSAPLVLYVLAYRRASDDSIEEFIWLVNIVVHCVVGIMVDVDVMCFSGSYWPWQLWIIGLATFTTLTLPGLLGLYLSSGDDYGARLTLAALALVCLSNAAMVSIVFEFLHRGLALLRIGPSQAPPASATPATPSAIQGQARLAIALSERRAAERGRR
jgi:hypothetical protein